LEKTKNNGQIVLDEYKSKHLLKDYGIPVVDEFVATDKTEAIKYAEKSGFPVVIKGLA